MIVSILFHCLLAAFFIMFRFESEQPPAIVYHELFLSSIIDSPAVDVPALTPPAEEIDIPESSPQNPIDTHALPELSPATGDPQTESYPAQANNNDLTQEHAANPPTEPSHNIEPDSPQEKVFTPWEDGDLTRAYADTSLIARANADSSNLTAFQRGLTLFEGTPYALRPSGRKAKTNSKGLPPEEYRDERRDFEPDIFGIPAGGLLAVFPVIKHAGKSIVWDIQDGAHQGQVDDMLRTHFASISEKDVRFLILMWRDGLLDFLRMSRDDRIFIASAGAQKAETSQSYLTGMYQRGLADGLKVEGRLVFRAAFPRDTVLTNLETAAADTAEYDMNTRMRLAKLITVCYDPTLRKIIIPDSLSGRWKKSAQPTIQIPE